MQKITPVLGIETSCDETAIAIYDEKRGLIAHKLYSQIGLHQPFGGVVPELASRDHLRKILPLIQETLTTAALNLKEIKGIGYCAGPGLVGALLVGAVVGRSLGWALGIPTLGVHHLEAHLLVSMLEFPAPSFPFIALLVSGGHTLLIQVNHLGDYQILGESLDDAAGEAFDKTAKLLNLPYPGGPALAELALKGNPNRFQFPRPMLHRKGLDFSFSGLKTFASTTLLKAGNDEQTRADIAHAFQVAVVASLVAKAEKALRQSGIFSLVVAGGVGANQLLRSELSQMIGRLGGSLFFPRPSFCTDNGAMIAYVAYERLNRAQQDGLSIQARARWPIDTLTS